MSTTTKQKRKHIKAVQQKLRLFRAKEPLLSVFMWGVNHSISELCHINIPVMLMPDDFKAHGKIKVDNHLFNKENMPSHFKFKEYCPMVFRNLREKFGVDDQEFTDSLTKHCPVDADSPGRSGARLLLSYDKNYVIKTITSEEVAGMHRILKEYHQYVVEKRSETLLPQYLAMYRVTVNDSETYMVVIRCIFSPRVSIHRKYDLKGSTVARQASDKEKAKDLPTYKDVDFINDGIRIAVGDPAKEKLLKTLQEDVDFLTSLNLMDYSLLVGLHDCERGAEEVVENTSSEEENGYEEEDEEDSPQPLGSAPTPPDSPVAPSFNAPQFTGEIDPKLELFAIRSHEHYEKQEIYFMALVDVLTHYGMKKRSAAAAKTMKYGAGAEISTVKPEQYARRFMEFVEKIIE